MLTYEIIKTIKRHIFSHLRTIIVHMNVILKITLIQNLRSLNLSLVQDMTPQMRKH